MGLVRRPHSAKACGGESLIGKHGWVMAACAPGDDVPTGLLLE
jgi:hypothetical protein